MRLIDADKLIEELTIKAVSKDAHIISIANAVVNFVNNQPTAYSVDEVVEELETNKQNALEVEESIKEYNVWNKAIEIVKHGGVADDVCEWKLDGVYLISPHKQLVSCVTDENYRYYYCPICGKKIKEV